MFGIHEDDDMLIGCASQCIMQLFQVQRRQIAVAVEGVEVGIEDSMLPDTLCWFAGTRFFGYRLEGNNVETVLHRLKRLVIEEGSDGFLTVIDVMGHFIGCVSLCHKGDTDAV